MSEPVASEHWLDRLAVRVTRRTALKAGLAAAAAITVPSLHPSGAHADITTYPCFDGCRAFEHQEFGRARYRCVEARNFSSGYDDGYTLPAVLEPFNIISALTQALLEDRLYQRCLDTAITNAKVAAFDCYADPAAPASTRGSRTVLATPVARTAACARGSPTATSAASTPAVTPTTTAAAASHS